MSSRTKKCEFLHSVGIAVTAILPLFHFEAGAQDKIDPAVVRAAQSYCLEKGLSILSNEFGACLSERIYSLGSVSSAPPLPPTSQSKSAPVGAPPPVIVHEPAPQQTPPQIQGLDTTGVKIYPESILYGNKDPDINWLGLKIAKRDLNIFSIPSNVTVNISYGSEKSFRRMTCLTPCRVGIPQGLTWSIGTSGLPKMYIASQFPEWRNGWTKAFYFSPDTIIFKSTEGLEQKLAKYQNDCEVEGKMRGTIKHINCVASKMENQ